MSRSIGHVFGVAVTCLILAQVPASAQPAPAVARAEALRDAGNFRQAVQVLRAHLAGHPDDGDAARLLAQTLYWLKDVRAAAAEYEAALRRHHDDLTLRLQYARMLVETGSATRARELLEPLPDPPDARATAETLLGLMSYWEGDLSAARTRFSIARQLNPANVEAKKYLDEIEASTAPWIRVGASAWHDDQPLDRAAFEMEGGWFPSPLTSIAVRAQPARYDGGATARTIQSADVTLKNYAPSARLDAELGFGVTSGAADMTDSMNWTGTASAAVHASAGVRVGGRASRSRYLYAVASIGTPVMVTTVSAFAHLDRRGWLGEAAFERQHYPDDNSIRTAYGWILAPIARNADAVVQIGYAVSARNALHSRFVFERPGDPVNSAGAYTPYYTPDHELTHSVLAAIAAGGRRAAFHANVSYGFAAHDNAPGPTVAGAAVVQAATRRDFTPWNARASFSFPLGRGAALEPNAEVGRTAFYAWRTAGAQVTWRLNPPR